ncbi:MAG: pantetheine-phosphate adenylyltransferase [Erysipelotrichaceae bacterium]|nr:pantetheine-phosphate adenylyltransferase [Erysipelotrichaceae bacterium]
MSKAMYPGSFDPITYGHMDIIERSSKMFEEVFVAVMVNDEKNPLFTTEERVDMIRKTVGHLPNVKVVASPGLTVDFARSLDVNVLIRGIRAVMDYEYELQQSTINMMLAPDIETVFLLSKPDYSFLSSSAARTVAKYHGDLQRFVPEYVACKLEEKMK